MEKEREVNKSFAVERYVESPQLLRIDRFKFEKRKRKFNLRRNICRIKFTAQMKEPTAGAKVVCRCF